MNLKKPDQLIQELKGMKFIPYFDVKPFLQYAKS